MADRVKIKATETTNMGYTLVAQRMVDRLATAFGGPVTTAGHKRVKLWRGNDLRIYTAWDTHGVRTDSYLVVQPDAGLLFRVAWSDEAKETAKRIRDEVVAELIASNDIEVA